MGFLRAATFGEVQSERTEIMDVKKVIRCSEALVKAQAERIVP